MKIVRAYICILLFLLIFSCGHEDGGEWEAAPEEKSASVSLAADLSPSTIENQITLDVLGGIFRADNSAGQGMTISKTIQQATELSPDISYNYSGRDGKGDLTLNISGSGIEKKIVVGSNTYTTREFSPLNLQFLFFNYAFYNPCLGEVRLNGAILCAATGEYKAGRFIGTAHCASGDGENINYKTTSASYEISLDANLKIGGNIYSYGSYSYSGNVIINGETKKIEDVLQTTAACSN